VNDVAFVGWTRPLPPGVCRCAPQLALRAFQDPGVRIPRFPVLGDEAATALDPLRARRVADRQGAHVVLCLERTPPVLVAAWQRGGFDDIVAPVDFAAHLDALLRAGPVPLVDPGELVERHPPPGTSGAEVLAAVPRSETLRSVSALARALGWNRKRVYRVCVGELRRQPHELLKDYAEHVECALRRDFPWLTSEDRAERIGYSDRTTLCRAMVAWRRRHPSLHVLPMSQTANTVSQTATDKRPAGPDPGA
jgi:hypothetical protein